MAMLRPLMSVAQAFEVPDLSAASRDAQTKTIEMIDAVVARLAAGDCILIYPSGRLQRSDPEIIGAARAAYDIITRSPETKIVRIRTRGVWGSSFSCAKTGTVPSLPNVVRRSFGWLMANFVFFMPRRPVSLTIEVVPRESLPLESRESFNSAMEQWYNIDGPQQPLFVRYHPFFGPSEGDFGAKAAGIEVDLSKIKPRTIEQVNHLLQTQLKRELASDELQPSATLESLGLDSLERMDLALRVEQQFGFRSSRVVTRVGELWALASGQLPMGASEPLQVPSQWNTPASTPDSFDPMSNLVGEAFVRRALERKNAVAIADRMSGALSYRRFLVGAALMARHFEKLPGANIGIMLPASVGADLAFYAAHLAGKVPVMLNWTTGPAGLAHAVSVTKITHVITANKLVDRLGVTATGADFIFLEDLRKRITKWQQLTTLLRSYLMPGTFLRNVSKAQADDTAVYLFTSGSESLPKTVPLTHRNLLTNVCDGLDVLSVDASDRLLGFLPPFHSFGLTGNVLLAPVAGIPCVRFADPTDARGLVETIAAYKPTMLFTTPTFLGFILAACKGDELHSLRKLITGAEKCPDHVFRECKRLAPHAQILEGYGITECSPVVAANRLNKTKQGTVGQPVKNVQAKVVDLETMQTVAPNETGMLLVRGPSIFTGYFQFEGPSPFIDFDGEPWYQTGDLVSMDDDGYITFRGRLKRFLKAGGEMISLPALEEPFTKLYPAGEKGPKVAVEGIETEDGRHVVLFTTFEYHLREASQVLHEAGFTGVMRLDEVIQVESIPQLGTGKTDYKQLRKLVEAAIKD